MRANRAEYFRDGVWRCRAILTRSLKRFTGESSGGVAMFFAFAIVPILIFIGAAVDYTSAQKTKAKYDAALDAAALIAVQSGSSAATTAFNARTGFNPKTPKCSSANGATTCTVSYSTTYTPLLWFPGASLTLAGTATATDSLNETPAPKYINIYVLVDISTSMGLGADATDQTNMINNTSIQCALACHGNGGQGPDTFTAARAAGYTLRIDVVKTALVNAIAQAQTTVAANPGDVIQFAIYTFDVNFHTVATLSSNYSALTTAVKGIDVSNLDSGTSMSYGLTQLAAQIKNVGNGSSSTAAQTYVLFMSDGVNNDNDNKSATNWTYSANAVPAFDGTPCWPGQTPTGDAGPTWTAPTGSPTIPKTKACVPDPYVAASGKQGQHIGNGQMEMMAIDPSWCNVVKATGAQVMTLYTQYVLLPTASTTPSDWTTNDWRVPYLQYTVVPQLQGNMASCASQSTYAFTGNGSATIASAIANMTTTALTGPLRLTQ